MLVALLWQPCPVVLAQQNHSAEPDLILGVFPRRNVKVTQEIYKPLVDVLTKTLGRKVVLETTYDFALFWQSVVKQRYDIVHYNQYHYIKSHHDNNYQVIAKNVELGHKDIAGAILVRNDSGINTLEELKGKKIVFGGGKKAMMAYITPTYLLRKAGLNDGDYVERFALNPPKAITAAYYHQAAAAGAGHYILELPVVKKVINTNEMKNLAISQKMTNLPWAIKDSMPDDLVSDIKRVLVTLYDTAEGRKVLKSARVTRFLPAVDSDFDVHREIVETVLGEKL